MAKILTKFLCVHIRVGVMFFFADFQGSTVHETKRNSFFLFPSEYIILISIRTDVLKGKSSGNKEGEIMTFVKVLRARLTFRVMNRLSR